MAKRKQYNMRWGESDAELLQRTINNFNQRLYRARKNNPENAQYMPSRTTPKKAVEQIQTRADFNALIKSLNRFTAESAKIITSKRGAKMTEWERKEDITKQRKIKKKEIERAEELESMEVKQGSKGTGVTRAEMGRLREQPKNIQITDPANLSQQEWELHRKLIESKMKPTYHFEKAKFWQQNYIKGLIRAGFPHDVIEMVQKVNPDVFWKVIDTNEYATFDFIYSPNELAGLADFIRETWQEHVGETEYIGTEMVQAKEAEVNAERESGYEGRRRTDDWWKWEREHWGTRRKPRKRGKKK